jgi:hypothetical protein
MPTYWLAGLWSWFYKTNYILNGTKWLSLLSIVLPFLAIWATVKWLAPKFIHAISLGEGQEVVQYKPSSTGKQKTKLYQRLAPIFNRNKEARAGFELAWLMTARNRAFKMKVYPSLAYIPIYFFFVVLAPTHLDNAQIMERMASTKAYLVLLYMCMFALLNAAANLIYSEQYKASWIYFVPPVQRPGNVMSGALKAIIVKFYLPFTILISLVIVYVKGISVLTDIFIAQFNIMIYILIYLRSTVTALPFSVKEQMRERGFKNFFRQLMVLLIVPFLGFAHYLTIKFWLLRFIVFPLILILFWMLWDSFKKTNWEAITHANSYE